jgi:hypothetical protein
MFFRTTHLHFKIAQRVDDYRHTERVCEFAPGRTTEVLPKEPFQLKGSSINLLHHLLALASDSFDGFLLHEHKTSS